MLKKHLKKSVINYTFSKLSKREQNICALFNTSYCVKMTSFLYWLSQN